jgi:hypothetical protein
VSKYITEWRQRQVLDQVLDNLAEQGEIVGKFVEDEARRRLVAIREPEWGTNYRQRVVARLLTNRVEKTRSGVIIWVGVQQGPKGSDHGLWIELGTRTTVVDGKRRPGHPPQPYLRPAVFENARKIVMLLEGK